MTTLGRPVPLRFPSRAWAIFALAAGIAVVGLVLFALAIGTTLPGVTSEPRGPLLLTALVVEAAIGALIAARRPRNPIGWIFLAGSTTQIFTETAGAYATYALLIAPNALPGGVWAAWFSFWTQRVAVTGIVAVFLFFPTGALPPGRWRYALVLTALSLVGFAARAFVPGPLGQTGVENPIGIQGLSPLVGTGFFGGIPLAAFVVLVSLRLGRRLRHTLGPERQQIKWLLLTLVVLAIAIVFTVASLVAGIDGRPAVRDVTAALYGAFQLSLPIAISIAILRYRLYDIDVLINRAIVYGALTALVAGAYAAGSKILERLFVALTGQNSDASTLIMVFVIAVGITPVRGRIQTFVDKRFKDPASLDRRLSAFAAEVRFVAEVLDRRRLAARFLTEVVEASGSPGGTFELPGADPIVAGQWGGEPGVAITLRGRAGMVGRLLLAQRADGSGFTPSEREQLQRTADVIAEAM